MPMPLTLPTAAPRHWLLLTAAWLVGLHECLALARARRRGLRLSVPAAGAGRESRPPH